jgi:hypothetical protein
MKKVLLTVLVGSLLAVGLTAEAIAKRPAKKVTRVASVAYDATNQIGVNTPVVALGYVYQELAIPSQLNEKYVSLTAMDQTGGKVYFYVNQSSTPPAPGSGGDFCGSTDQPLRIYPGASVNIWIWQGSCADGSPALATTGSIEATFSNVP